MKAFLATALLTSSLLTSVFAQEVVLSEDARVSSLNVVEVKVEARGRSMWSDVSAAVEFSNACHARLHKDIKYSTNFVGEDNFEIYLVSSPEGGACAADYNPVTVTFKIPLMLPSVEGLKVSVNGVEAQ